MSNNVDYRQIPLGMLDEKQDSRVCHYNNQIFL